MVLSAQSGNNACLVLSSRTKWSAIKIEGIRRLVKKSTEWGVISSSWGLRRDTRQGGEIYFRGKSNPLIARDRLGIGGTQKPGSIDPGLPARPGRPVPAARASDAFCVATLLPRVPLIPFYPKGVWPSHRAEPARRPEGAEPVRRPGSGASGIQTRWTQQDGDQDPKQLPTGWRASGGRHGTHVPCTCRRCASSKSGSDPEKNPWNPPSAGPVQEKPPARGATS